MYETIKYSHILFVSLSILLFEYRFLLKMLNKPIGWFLSVVPHVNDTLLFITGISLAIIAGFNPVNHTWLAMKLIALVLYIFFGILALKSSGAKSIMGFILATIAIVFMLYTALTKNPLFFTV